MPHKGNDLMPGWDDMIDGLDHFSKKKGPSKMEDEKTNCPKCHSDKVKIDEVMGGGFAGIMQPWLNRGEHKSGWKNKFISHCKVCDYKWEDKVVNGPMIHFMTSFLKPTSCPKCKSHDIDVAFDQNQETLF